VVKKSRAKKVSSESVSVVKMLRIVSLPCELQTEEDVKYFLENTLDLGKMMNMSIVKLKTGNTYYRTCFVEWKEKNVGKVGKMYMDSLMKDGLFLDTLYTEQNGEIISQEGNFHFENGKPMSHLKITYSEAQKESVVQVDDSKVSLLKKMMTEPVLDVSDTWSSIYLPSVIGKHKEEAFMKEVFLHENIGQVSRVDYVAKKTNEKELTTAYVHFEKWYDTPLTQKIRSTIEKEGQYKYFVNPHSYLLFRINHTPIKTVTDPSLNIHQMSAKAEYFEKESTYLKDLVVNMQKELYFLRSKYEDVCGMRLPWIHAQERRLTAEEAQRWKEKADVVHCSDESVEYFLPSESEEASDIDDAGLNAV